MIKIKLIKVILGIFLILIASQLVYAAGSKLFISDMDVDVDGRSSTNLDDGDRIRREAKPESDIEVKVEVKNNFTDAEDLDIEDIAVTVTIQEIDDDDDLEEDATEFDLRAGRDKTVTLRFKLPLEVDEGTFDVLIEAEGDDENGTMHTATARLELEVEKEKNEVRFYRTSLTPNEISCQRTVQLSVGTINTGAEEEDGVVLEITNTELGVNFREVYDLTDDPFDTDSKFNKVYTVRVPNEVQAGIYPIQAKVLFDDGDKSETTNLELVVGNCEALTKPEEVEKPPVEEEEEKVEEEKPEVVLVSPPQVTVPENSVTTVSEPTGSVITTEEKSLFDNSWFVVALIGGEIFVILLIIILVFAFMRRR